MSSKANIISDILQDLYDNRKELSNARCGVYEIDGVYKLHVSSFIPRVWSLDSKVDELIGKVVEINFHRTMEWNAQTLWVTMKDNPYKNADEGDYGPEYQGQ